MFVFLCNVSKPYEGTFKKRFSGHKPSFNLERYKHSTALSTEAWLIEEIGMLSEMQEHTRPKRNTMYTLLSGKF